jgi:DNA-binding MarR family transcriptional regulator
MVLLRDYDLSPTQYNLLRILRGAEPWVATCSQIGERMINHDPYVTRLLDRNEDRRVVLTRITRQGLDLVAGMDVPVRAFLKARLGKLDQRDLTALIGQLEQIREVFQSEKEKL